MNRDEVLQRIDSLRQRRHNIRPREIEQLAESAGWTYDRSTGSHLIYVREGFWANLSIPQHRTLKGNLALRLLTLIEASLAEEE